MIDVDYVPNVDSLDSLTRELNRAPINPTRYYDDFVVDRHRLAKYDRQLLLKYRHTNAPEHADICDTYMMHATRERRQQQQQAYTNQMDKTQIGG
jgi:hypothetical protein